MEVEKLVNKLEKQLEHPVEHWSFTEDQNQLQFALDEDEDLPTAEHVEHSPPKTRFKYTSGRQFLPLPGSLSQVLKVLMWNHVADEKNWLTSPPSSPPKGWKPSLFL